MSIPHRLKGNRKKGLVSRDRGKNGPMIYVYEIIRRRLDGEIRRNETAATNKEGASNARMIASFIPNSNKAICILMHK